VKRALAVLLPLAALGALMVLWVGTASAVEDPPWANEDEDTTALSGPVATRTSNSLGNAPHGVPAGRSQRREPKPLRQLAKDQSRAAEQRPAATSERNHDYSCFPQDETSLDINPQNGKNIVGGCKRLPASAGGPRGSTPRRTTATTGTTDHPVPVIA